MSDFGQSFVLALNAGEIGTIIAVLLAVISWIANIAGGGQQQQQPQQKARPRRGENEDADPDFAQQFEEIDETQIEVVTESRMEEQRRERARQRQQQQQQRQRQQPSGQRQPRRRHPATRRNQAAEQRRQQAAAQAQRQSSRTNLESRQEPGSSDLGAGLQQHLVEYMDDRVGSGVKATGTGVESSVQSKFGAPLDLPPAQEELNEFAKMFRNPESVKQAIILNEILAKPKSLR